MRRLAGLVAAVSLMACLLVALGFLGAFFAPFDTASHFRLHLGALLLGALPVLLFFRFWRCGAVAGATATVALTFSLPFLFAERVEPSDGPSYALLQMNLRWNAQDRSEVLRRIADTRPDVIALQEMTPQWRERLSLLDAAYPHQVHCEDADGFSGDSAILSRRPFVPNSDPLCDSDNSLARARIDFNGTGVTLVSHHQLWPWPAGQWRRLERLGETLASLPQPVLIAGDFNAVPWSALLSGYAQETRTRVVRGIGPTWFFEALPAEWGRWIGLPIDNVLVSERIVIHETRRLAATESDHLPILTRFSIRRAPASDEEVRLVETLRQIFMARWNARRSFNRAT